MANENPQRPPRTTAPSTPPPPAEETDQATPDEENLEDEEDGESDELGPADHPIVQSESWQIMFEAAQPLVKEFMTGLNEPKLRELAVRERDIEAALVKSRADHESKMVELDVRKLELEQRKIEFAHQAKLSLEQLERIDVPNMHAQHRRAMTSLVIRSIMALALLLIGLFLMVRKDFAEGTLFSLMALAAFGIPLERLSSLFPGGAKPPESKG